MKRKKKIKTKLKIRLALNFADIHEEHWILHTSQQIGLSLTEQLYELVPELHNGVPLRRTACQKEWVMLKILQQQAQLSCWLWGFILSTFLSFFFFFFFFSTSKWFEGSLSHC